MRIVKKLSILIIIMFFLVSCKKIMFLIAIKKTVHKEIKIYENEQNLKQVFYIPTVHLGKKPYYASIKNYVDSLRSKNFLILYEGVMTEKTHDTIFRKFRKVAGFHISSYNNVENKSLSSRYKKKKYLNQTSQDIGLQYDKDINVDYDLTSLITDYEKKYKKITLNEYDYSTQLNAKYDIKQTKGHNHYFLINSLRDEYLFKMLKKYNAQNVVLLYGAGHKYMIHANLTNENYKLIKGKLF